MNPTTRLCSNEEVELVREKWRKKMVETFTSQELADILFTPLVIAHIFWGQVERTLDIAAAERIPETKRLARAVREQHREYLSEMREQLDTAHRNQLLEQVDSLMAQNFIHVTKLFFTVDNEILKRNPQMLHDKVRAQAIVAGVFGTLAESHVKNIGKWATPRFGGQVCRLNPHVKAAAELIGAFVGEAKIEATQPIELGVKIITNVLKNATFNL